MKVKFIHYHLGRETAMREKKPGDEMEIEQQAALELLASGVVKEVKPKEKANVTNTQ